ncbi:MAG: DUF1549 and DUF1553 domain-containing protein [Gemmataceae bacterium]|nr:DUF1549 and DUF1553 domain-containing protein [Gemmataceae bacterium]
MRATLALGLGVLLSAGWLSAGDPSAPAAAAASSLVAERKAAHWCWQPVRRPKLPILQNSTWPARPVDHFVLSALEQSGVSAPPAIGRLVWLRRVYFDLIGLPPTVAEIEQFEGECASMGEPAAMARVVEELLGRPEFGERWARHWLDLVRYAETKGQEYDAPIPNAYHYRDYVIRAFNGDLPYDQFVVEHIAGDLLPKPRLSQPQGANESILATGFWFLGEELHSPVDTLADECDRIDNQIDVFSKTFLGLTVHCARCHDHKFDPITQRDYYALSGFLLSSSYRQVRFDTMAAHERIRHELDSLRQRHREAALASFADLFRRSADTLRTRLLAARQAMRRGTKPSAPETAAWVEFLRKIENDEAHPFYPWARVCREDDGDLANLIEDCLREHDGEAGRPTDLHPPVWKSDGPSFMGQGGVIWGQGAARPIVGFSVPGEFRRDPFWNRLRTPPGTESDYGALGKGRPRYGYLLRSIKFRTSQKRVWVWVRGQGRIYAAVDSHKLIEGPLHSRLVRDFDTAGRWQWVPMDLDVYQGHRLHLEVWPTNEQDFAVGEFRESEHEPPPPRPWGEALRHQGTPASAEALATAYQAWLIRVLDALAQGDDRSPWVVPLADLLCRQPELFGVSDFRPLHDTVRELMRQQEALAANVPWESRWAPAIWDFNGVDDHVRPRGAPSATGPIAPRRFLEALGGPEPLVAPNSGRLELAAQLVDPRINPLIGRVMVNRVWKHLLGRGIVPTVDDFGVMGERPVNPDLLDYLADWFVNEGGWSIKRLIREVVLSRTYRSPSVGEDGSLIRGPRLKRLEGEAIRDAMLAISGRLDRKHLGPSVPIYLGNIAGEIGRPSVNGPLDGAGRRSIYIAVRRNFLSPWMLAFDMPAPFSTNGRRAQSNVPAQALVLMNDPLVHQLAARWGAALHARDDPPEQRIEQMYLAAFCRPPDDTERRTAKQFVEQHGSDRVETWSALAHVLWNVKEFIFIP